MVSTFSCGFAVCRAVSHGQTEHRHFTLNLLPSVVGLQLVLLSCSTECRLVVFVVTLCNLGRRTLKKVFKHSVAEGIYDPEQPVRVSARRSGDRKCFSCVTGKMNRD